MKKSTIRDIATSSTTLVFLVVGITGVMLYFKIFNGQVKELHEILGLAFVVATALHVFVNWKSMKSYFTKKTFISLSIVVLIISAIFVSQSLNRGSDPKGLVLRGVINAPINISYQVLGVSDELANKKLKEANIIGLDKNTIMNIAKENGVSPFKIISIITAK